MTRRTTVVWLVLCLVGLIMAVYLASCGSGGGGGGGGFVGGAGQEGTATVSVLLADGPADEFDHIYITVTEVSLIPVRGNPVVLFRSRKGCEVDLLKLREEDFLLTVNRRIPARLYEKIRLRVSEIRAEGGPCEELEIKLPSGKIDLNPREAFKMVSGGTYWIRLDIDANKSIHLHQAGQSGKCIFRPVVFVEIEEGLPVPPCPRILCGTIGSFIEGGFVLEREGPDLEIFLAEDVAIFDENGMPIDASDLGLGDPVKVRGKLEKFDGGCRFVASVVVVGQVEIVEGTAESVVDSNDQFSFRPLGEAGTIPVQIFEETLLLFGCDTEIDDPSIIKPGVIVRVVGKEENGVLNAVIVFLREIVGVVTYFDENSGDLTIQANGEELDILVPPYTPFYLIGDGDVPPELLCIGKQVRVVVDPDYNSHSYDFKAKEVQIEPDQFQGVITRFLPDRVLEVEMEEGGLQEVYVPPGATILDLTATEGLPTLFFSELIIGDNLNLIGLYSCDNGDFTGFVVLKIEPPAP